MSNLIPAVIVFIAFIVLAVLILRPGNRARRKTPEQQAEDRRLYEQRILDPDWEFCERHLQRPVPPGLRELYADRDLIVGSVDLGEAGEISSFYALDEQEVVNPQPLLDFEILPIAGNLFGDPVYLRSGPSEADTVYVTYHDGGDTEVFAESVSDLLAMIKDSKLRSANPTPPKPPTNPPKSPPSAHKATS